MTAAEVLAQHQSESLRCCLPCGHQSANRADHAAHQVDALKAAGYAVVELPKSNYSTEVGDHRWPTVGIPIWTTGGGVSIGGISKSHSEARTIAASILAAADAAEAS